MSTTHQKPAEPTAPNIPEELDRLIARAERHQQRLGLNDSRFVAQYTRFLGKSTDTWTRTLKRRDPLRLTPNNIPKWTAIMRKLVAEIDGTKEGETVYENMPMIRAAVALYDRLQGADNDRRVAWLIGQPGTGKSVSLRHLRRSNPQDTAYIIADPQWNGCKSVIVSELATAIGVPAKKKAAETMASLVEHLKATPTTILLDEFHEGGVLLFKIIKTLVNKAPQARFILATLPTAYARMTRGSTEAYEESRQLRGRSVGLIKKLWEKGIREVDISAYLESAAPEISAEDRPAFVHSIAHEVNELGLRLLADAVSSARGIADGDDTPLTADHIKGALEVLKNEI